MRNKVSAGIMLYRMVKGSLEVYIVHPGGPVFRNRDLGAWSIPKGEIEENEEHLVCAIRELEEEVGLAIEPKDIIPLGTVRQKSGKLVYAWAVRHDEDFPLVNSNSYFFQEWPPKSGRNQKFPEVDKAQFFKADEAREKINPAQAEFITRLEEHLNGNKNLSS
jgi:predicted NUDIX family NTP pyrophosphohydrolase